MSVRIINADCQAAYEAGDERQRNAILCELNPEYAAMARRRIEGEAPLFAEVGT